MFTISKTIPIQFWLEDEESYNEMALVGVQKRCWCQPIQCADTQKIVFYDTESKIWKLNLFNSSGDPITSLTFTETVDGDLFVYTLDIASFEPYCNQKITANLANYVDDSTTTTGPGTSTTSTTTTTTSTTTTGLPLRTLTLSYSEGQFNITLDGPVDDDILIEDVTVEGSTIPGCSSADETDTIPSHTLLASDVADDVPGTTPMSCAIGTYKMLNGATIDGVSRVDNDIFTVGSYSVQLQINTGCVTYPCTP